MMTSNLGRKLKAWAMSASLAAAMASNAIGQEGRGGLMNNPVPQGQGWVNPRRPDVGQGDGRFGPVRTRRDSQGQLQVRQHNGLDLSGPVGTPVESPVSGIVIRSVPNWRGENANGNEVRVLGDDGREYWFFHLSGRNQPAIGERLEAGMSVGEVGRTAIPEGAASHLHFEVRENGRPVAVESLGGDTRQGLFNYLLSQPQTSREEAEIIRRYLDQEPKLQQQPAPAAEPSLFDRIMDYIIPSAHGQTRPEGAGGQLSVNEAAEEGQSGPSGGTRFEYDDSARDGDGSGPRRHVPREESIEVDIPVHEGAEWLQPDHREGAAPPESTPNHPYGGQNTTPGDLLQLPSQPGSDSNEGPTSGGEAHPEPMRLEHPEIVSPEQLTVPSPTPRPTPGMSQDEFRRSLEQSMDEFRQADEFNRQNPLRIPGSLRPTPSAPLYDEQSADNPTGAPQSEYAPRQQESWPPRNEPNTLGNYSTGDFMEGYTPQAPMSQPQPQRRNRVYWDGGSRPIGSQNDSAVQQYRRMQNWSNQQIQQMNRQRQERSSGGRYYDYGATPVPMPTPLPTVSPTPTPTGSPSPSLSPRSSTPADYTPTYTIGFDDNAPRGRSRFGYDETQRIANRISEPARTYGVPELPSGRSAVETRTSGATASTAALHGP